MFRPPALAVLSDGEFIHAPQQSTLQLDVAFAAVVGFDGDIAEIVVEHVCDDGVSGLVIGHDFVAFIMDMEKGEEHQRQFREEQRSGKLDFGDQPALFAVAQAIAKNDQDAIRAAAKALPDLQAPGGNGATLLYFAVTQSWQRPELAEAVRTLLSLGADPNYTNGKQNSFAMANAVHASEPVLRAMLEAGGNPNARDEFGEPMILMNWYLGYYPNQARSRLELLLDHGADVNSAMPETASDSAGYTLLLYRTKWDSTTTSPMRMR